MRLAGLTLSLWNRTVTVTVTVLGLYRFSDILYRC